MNNQHQGIDLSQFTLHDEKTFFESFKKDLENCKDEVIIECPYITSRRMKSFYPIFNRLLARGVTIIVVTRNPNDHENKAMRNQAEIEVSKFERMGIQPLLCVGNHHRKLAILDRKILWEGSLNILSQACSREIMKRTNNADLTLQMFDFLKIGNYL